MKLVLLGVVFLGGVYFGMQADQDGELAGLVGIIDAFIQDASKR